ncbi:MAG TPA: hypothetical protein VFK37_03215 [Bacillales bacterium]|nr:hypothetical protein [Bacillales bacterium]
MKKWLVSLLALILASGMFTSPVYALARFKQKPVVLSVKATPDATYETTRKIREKGLAKKLLHAREKSSGHPMPLSDVTLLVGSRRFLVDRKGNVYDLDSEKQAVLPEAVEKRLLRYAGRVRKKHYGALVPWVKVKEWIPRKAVFTVRDLRTGKRFEVQRRAGSAHADVQPLTREDTKKMKEIYDGKWSWRRRAILVEAHGRRIAASMHGMPHGAGALANGFPGHFCIHFLGSTTHRTKKVDPTHEIMIYEAAGKIHDFLEKATPYEIVDTFFVAANQKDDHLLKRILSRKDEEQVKELLEILDPMDAIKPDTTLWKEDSPIVGVELPVIARIYENGHGKMKRKLLFIVSRNAPGERWLIDTQALLECFK